MTSNTVNFEYNDGWGRRDHVVAQNLVEEREPFPNWRDDRAESLRRGNIAPAEPKQAKG